MSLIRIATEDGNVGHSFLGSALGSGQRDARVLIDALKPMLVGQNAFDRERLWSDMMRRTRGSLIRPIGAVDVALWDLAGNSLGLPIHKLIGSYRNSVPAYASSAVYATAEEYAEEAAQIKNE
ncbi:MAG: mandelate racemase, partial [Gammaproteobacteria bacterium]|nr:mandelate racemase [Gammaproteobacteria bacterium]